MKNLHVTDAVLQKLKVKHGVNVQEVEKCFLSRSGKLLFDTRALTKTIPPTLRFIAKTNQNRLLKIVYIQKGVKIILKTAYEPNEAELAIYSQYG